MNPIPAGKLRYRIALITCYFGKLPPYAELVFHSARFNPSIDWLIFGDQRPDFPLPANVQFSEISIKELAEVMQAACETPVKICKPLDIARLKPTYGLCFASRLTGYDFWGHVDIDMIYGDLRAFLADDILEKYVRIYCRGHLSLFKNTPEVNRLFMLDAPGAPGYRQILANEDKSPFDEWAGIWKIFRYHRIPQYHDEVIADIKPPNLHWITRFEAEELTNYRHQVFYWHEGKTFQAFYHREGGLFDREVGYVHFQKRQLPSPDFNPSEVAGFTIGPAGFEPYNRENLSEAEMDRLNSPVRRPVQDVIRRKLGHITRGLKKRLGKEVRQASL